jgi:hypothetical protein
LRGAAFDLAPGGVYLATPVTWDAGALLPHRFTLTCVSIPKNRTAGGLFSVALSRESPRVAVNNRPALWSPDFPRPEAERNLSVGTSSRSRPANSFAIAYSTRLTSDARRLPGHEEQRHSRWPRQR